MDKTNNKQNNPEPNSAGTQLTPMGRICRIGANYSYIRDDVLHRAMIFKTDDLIGEKENYSVNDLVVFTTTSEYAFKLPLVKKVLNVLDVDKLLKMARTLLEDYEYELALDILDYVMSQFPSHNEALELRKYLAIDPSSKSGDIKPRTNAAVKPFIVLSPDTIAALPLSLPKMTEAECKDIERELDSLIRNGQREICLQKTYDLLGKRCPTPKYLMSYLDRIVNTEVALNHTQQAIDALAQLIAFSETQDTKPAHLSHLYITLARLFKKQGVPSESIKAFNCAELLTPGSKFVELQRTYLIPSYQNRSESADQDLGFYKQEDIVESSIAVSKMLQQDVEFLASSVETEDSMPWALLRRAEEVSKDTNKSFESRAQLYLEASASFFKKGMIDTPPYKKAVANYARMKGNSMFLKLNNSISNYSDNYDQLIAYCDSACNYFTEALGIFNGLRQKRYYLQDLFLKYLKLRKVSSQIQGGKTPDPEWSSGTLKSILQECLKDVWTEDFKVFAYSCIAIGSAAEGAWNSLASDKDGIGPFTGKLSNPSYRISAFQVFNSLEQCDVDIHLGANVFLHNIFAHRQERAKQFSHFLSNCLKWQFNQFEMAIFMNDWQRIDDFSDILLTTDANTVSSINQVINTLLPYADLNDANRMQRLISSQQTLIKSIEVINDTTTFYGRTFFYQLETKWLKSISKTIEEKYAETQPRLIVEPDPHFIKVSGDGKQFINFVITNKGESTADSFFVKVSWHNSHEELPYTKTIDADKSVAMMCPIAIGDSENSVCIRFEVTTQYNGRSLSPSFFEHTYEKDDGGAFKSEIPWTIDGTPEANVFVGRQDTLDKLLRHYSSKDRSHTYIMYGLTRTGKTSILDYLREKIEGLPLDEKPEMTIMAFSWLFQNAAYKKDDSGLNENRFWEYLIKTTFYDKLPSNLQNAIDSSYETGSLPRLVGQNDFLKIIDILNNNNVMPFFTVDEFSNVRLYLDHGTLNASFLSILRDLSLNGKACFIYAGTYDIKELPQNKEYGITGQLVHTRPLEINSISDEECDKLIDSWGELEFELRAKEYIKNLSGRVPYWIQWICLDCGKYAIKYHYHHLGYSEVNKVVRFLTGEVSSAGDKDITWEKIDITNFQQNQYMPGENEDAECAVISCIAFLNRNNYEYARGVSIKDLKGIWDKYSVSNDFQLRMIEAIKRMVARCTLSEYSDEGRVVYKLNVDLFRRYWYANYPNLSTYLTSK